MTCYDFHRDAELLRRRRYGMIEVVDGQLSRIVLRLWPTIPTWFGARVLGAWRHRCRAGKVCRLYYNQPHGKVNFLTLAYVESDRQGGLASFRGALAVLDQIAALKKSDFIVTDVANSQISNRLLARWGWAPLAPRRWHRLYIKRLYDHPRSFNLAAGPAMVEA